MAEEFVEGEEGEEGVVETEVAPLLAVAEEDSAEAIGVLLFFVTPIGIETEMGVCDDVLKDLRLTLLCFFAIVEWTLRFGQTEIDDEDA